MWAPWPPIGDHVAEKVIGLDVGTSGVRAVSLTLGDRPRLDSLAQVPLPAGAVQEGEVVDPPAVAGALRALWKAGGFKNRSVRLAIASPRVIVRPVDMPTLSESDTRAALRLQLGDYIPMPPDATLFDFQDLADGRPEPGRDRQVLLAAAPRDAVQPLVEAARQAGLRVAHIDVAAVALARVLGESAPDDTGRGGGTEAIVSIGAGTIVVVVVRAGQPVFARTVSNSAGAHISDRIAMELAVQPAEAERLKRRLPSSTPPDVAERILVITDPFVTELTEEIGDSLDYYAAQPGGERVDSVTITGGAALVVGLEHRLEQRTGVPVRLAEPLGRLAAGATGLDSNEVAKLAPLMAVAVGTALGADRSLVRPINLTPESAGLDLRSRRPLLVGGVAAALLIGGVYLYLGQSRDLSAAKSERSQAQEELTAARQRASTARGVGPQAAAVQSSLLAVFRQARTADIDWAAVSDQVDKLSEPLGVGITSAAGTVVAAAQAATPSPTTTVAGASTAPAATVASLKVSGTAPDLFVVAAWLDAVTADGRFEAAWVDSTTAVDGTLQFNATVTLSHDNNLVSRPALEGAAP
jgi:type IV pilus assembly protein PilM